MPAHTTAAPKDACGNPYSCTTTFGGANGERELPFRRQMGGEIDHDGTRKAGLDAFLEERVAEGFAVETRTGTHAIIFRRPRGLRRFRSADDPGRFVVEVDEDGNATMRPAEPRRS